VWLGSVVLVDGQAASLVALFLAVVSVGGKLSKKVDSSLPAVYAGIYAGESVDPEAQPLRYVGLDFGIGFTPLPPRVVPEARGPTRVRVYAVNNMADVESWVTVCVTGALCVEG
jgi:hypothetical protein